MFKSLAYYIDNTNINQEESLEIIFNTKTVLRKQEAGKKLTKADMMILSTLDDGFIFKEKDLNELVLAVNKNDSAEVTRILTAFGDDRSDNIGEWYLINMFPNIIVKQLYICESGLKVVELFKTVSPYISVTSQEEEVIDETEKLIKYLESTGKRG